MGTPTATTPDPSGPTTPPSPSTVSSGLASLRRRLRSRPACSPPPRTSTPACPNRPPATAPKPADALLPTSPSADRRRGQRRRRSSCLGRPRPRRGRASRHGDGCTHGRPRIRPTVGERTPSRRTPTENHRRARRHGKRGGAGRAGDRHTQNGADESSMINLDMVRLLGPLPGGVGLPLRPAGGPARGVPVR